MIAVRVCQKDARNAREAEAVVQHDLPLCASQAYVSRAGDDTTRRIVPASPPRNQRSKRRRRSAPRAKTHCASARAARSTYQER